MRFIGGGEIARFRQTEKLLYGKQMPVEF